MVLRRIRPVFPVAVLSVVLATSWLVQPDHASTVAMQAAAAIPDHDISGTWVTKTQGPMGEIEIAYTLKVENGRITGQQSLPFGDSPITDGTVTGDTFHFTVQLESFGTLTDHEITGKIVGDTLVLTPAMPNRPPGGGVGGPGGPPPSSASAAAPPRPRFVLGEVTLHRGTPTPSFRAAPVDYKTLHKVTLPALHPVPYNGLATLPPMGWNSWNKFQTHIDDKTVRGVADAMVASGMKAAGYQYLVIDDGWQAKTRNADGTLSPNTNFPDMKALAAYVHSKGLKIGIYSSPGPRTCGNFQGSYGHEAQDAAMFASWGMDYLKYDWCSASRVWQDSDMQAAYQLMGDALQATRRPIVYALCQYGKDNVEHWAPQVSGNLYRTTGDIRDSWESMTTIGFAQSRLAPFAGPGHWNDPDMLEVGNGKMSDEEYRTHVALWAMIAAPLIAGNDLRSMTPAIHDILTNREILAVDQDPLGAGGKEVYTDGSIRVWSKQLQGGALAVAVFNTGMEVATPKLDAQRLGAKGTERVRDLWRGSNAGLLSALPTLNVPAHGVVMLRLDVAR